MLFRLGCRQWLKWVGTRGNAVPPKAFSVPSKKNSVPTKVISVPSKNRYSVPSKGFCVPSKKICGTSENFIDYSPSKSGRNSFNYPPPLEFTELHRLPPLEIGPENSFNYPPLEFTELHRLPPPLEIGPERTGTLPWKRSHCKKFPL